MSDYTLEPFEWVEIDQDFCSRTYGSAPCTAALATGGSECFNTRFTCQDPANYDRGAPLVLRFCVNQAFLPDDGYYIPTLVSARTSAGSINPVGAGQNSSALGTRGGLAVEFQDGPHTDKWVDPYVAARHGRDLTYIPVNRGTFWTKWRARNPYYVGRQIRHKTGFINTATHAVENVVTRTYFITDFEGPGADGRVTLQARDLLSLVSNDKATAPFASKGKLLNDITDSQTTLQLDSIGIGDDEYALAGVIRLGSELCNYTRTAGSDTLTIVRGRYNTEAKAAKAGDVVQKCLVYSAQRPAAILEDLLTTYAGIAPGYLDLAQWAQEQTDYLPRLYGAIIAAPTGVLELINEMCQQMYFYPVWDERQAKLKIRAIRPSDGEEVKSLDDFSNLIEGSVQLRDLPDQLVTQVWVYYGIINPAGSATDDKNYAVREIVATGEGAPEKQGIEKVKKIYCRWIPSSNGAAAVDLGEKLLARYGAAPRQASFALAEKDASLWLGDFVSLNHRLSVDTFGNPRALNMQVMSAQQARAGVLFQYVCQEFVYEAPVDPAQRLIVIAADQLNVNLRELHDLLYVPPVGGETINVVIRSGVVIGGRSLEGIETYDGQQRYEVGGAAAAYPTRPLHRIMRKELVSDSNMPVGTNVWLGPAGQLAYVTTLDWPWYKVESHTRMVPCSVAFDTGLWPAGVTINVLQEAGAVIEGEAGLSSSHFAMGGTAWNYLSGRGGLLFASDGGAALRIRHPVSWNNQGAIAGGGGGGFPGLMNCILRYGIGEAFWVAASPSGGGAGRYSAAVVTPADGSLRTYIRTASAGSDTAGGYGAKMQLQIGSQFPVVTGGTGGNLGAAGAHGSYALTGSGGYFTALYSERFTGGRAGDAIKAGASLITWVNKGDVRGAEIA